MTMGLASQTVLPMSSSGKPPARLRRDRSGRRHPPGNRFRGRTAADDVIFLAVAGRGVDRAGALLQRDVIGQDAERIALQKRMAEDGAFQREPGKRRALSGRPSRTFRGDLQQVGGDDVDGTIAACPTSTATYSNFG
jgi:hypothetical protein